MNDTIQNGATTPIILTPSPRRGRKANGGASDIKTALIAKLSIACNAYATACAGMGTAAKAMGGARASLKTVVAELAQSGQFTKEELVALVQSHCEKAGLTPQAASKALIAAGIRQRAPRSDAGQPRGGENPPANPPAEIPVDPSALAKMLVAKLGKEGAVKCLASAYAMASLG